MIIFRIRFKLTYIIKCLNFDTTYQDELSTLIENDK